MLVLFATLVMKVNWANQPTALAVGLSMAMIDANVLFASIVIFVITLVLSMVGLLVVIGLQILFSHIVA